MLTGLLYGILVGGLLTLAAHFMGKVCFLFTRPARWVWMAALVFTGILFGVVLYQVGVFPHSTSTQHAPASSGAKVPRVAALATPTPLFGSLQFARRQIATPIQQTFTIPARRVPVSLDHYIALGCSVFSIFMLLFFFAVYLHFRRLRRRWPIGELRGVRVRIAPTSGPVVIGVLHPEIVIPQWLLGCTTEQQQMVLTHEQEHIRAGDPWLLAIACFIASLLPWHPLVWWMMSRLRLAIELDCDARVIRHGVPPRSYGALLIDVAERGSDFSPGAPALAANPSHLKRRILAMKFFRPRFAAARGMLFGASATCLLVMASVLAACSDATSPSAFQRAKNTVVNLVPSAKQVSSSKTDTAASGSPSGLDSAGGSSLGGTWAELPQVGTFRVGLPDAGVKFAHCGPQIPAGGPQYALINFDNAAPRYGTLEATKGPPLRLCIDSIERGQAIGINGAPYPQDSNSTFSVGSTDPILFSSTPQTLVVVRGNDSTVLASARVTFSREQMASFSEAIYSVMLTQRGDKNGLIFLPDTISFASPDSQKFRLVNIAPDVGAVDVYMTPSAPGAHTRRLVSSNIAYEMSSHFVSYPAGSVEILVTPTGHPATTLYKESWNMRTRGAWSILLKNYHDETGRSQVIAEPRIDRDKYH